MVQEKLKRNIKSISFIIVFSCSMVTVGKNTKKTKQKKNSKKYSSLGTPIQKCMWKNLGDHIHLVF